MAERTFAINPNVPLTTRCCAFICLVITVALTLYGYMRGFYYSFFGPFIIIVCVVVMVKGTGRPRRRRRETFLEGTLDLTDSEADLARHNPVAVIQRRLQENTQRSENDDAQRSLLQRCNQETNAGPDSTWIWRRPPSYCNDGNICKLLFTLFTC